MITAIDTNVLVDVFLGDPTYGPTSMQWLQDAGNLGDLVICSVVYAELVHGSRDRSNLDETIATLGLSVSSISTDISFDAGLRWSRYRLAGGSRTRILPDFLIGAHALHSADYFLTRDNGFYRTYFPELRRPRSI